MKIAIVISGGVLQSVMVNQEPEECLLIDMDEDPEVRVSDFPADVMRFREWVEAIRVAKGKE